MNQRASAPEPPPDNAAPRAAFSSAIRQLITVLVALLGAALSIVLHAPLPWLIGPLVAVALVGMLGVSLRPPGVARAVGQWTIGIALGLYFSPEVVREVGRLAPWVLATIAFAITLGAVGAWALSRAMSTDDATAFFSMAIGGASEMAVQAQRHGGRVDRVAAAHSLRLMIVVVTVPFLFKAMDVHGVDPEAPVTHAFSWAGLAVLLAVTAAAAAVMNRLDWPNGWMIGPLLTTAALTASDQHLSSLPTLVVNGGQLLIGMSLGSHFTAEFFRAAPRFLLTVALITVAYLVVAAGFGLLLAHGSGLRPATALIATTPGGIGEMALTARALDLGVAIVTAFHALRMVVVVLTVGPIFRFWAGRRAGASRVD